jgi:hypothetical protein
LLQDSRQRAYSEVVKDHRPNGRYVFSIGIVIFITFTFVVPLFGDTNGEPASSSAWEDRFYSPASFWNRLIPANASVDPESAAIIKTSILPYAQTSVFSNGDDWGISMARAQVTDKLYTVICTKYYDTGPVTFRIPAGTRPTTGSDHHLVVIDGYRELDLWDAHYDPVKDTWSAGTRFIGWLDGWGANALPGQRAGGSVAAGFSEMGGVVRPEEIERGHIDHALSVMIPKPKNCFIAPATAGDGTNADVHALPEGAHLQLDPAFDVDSQPWPAWEKTLARALQQYGAYVSDTGGAIGFYGQTDINKGNILWARVDVPKNAFLYNLPWAKFRVLDYKR